LALAQSLPHSILIGPFLQTYLPTTLYNSSDSQHCHFDILEYLPTKACVELTRRLLSMVSSLPTGEARPQAVLIIVILFIAEYGCVT
jgi:hypothetical protein